MNCFRTRWRRRNSSKTLFSTSTTYSNNGKGNFSLSGMSSRRQTEKGLWPWSNTTSSTGKTIISWCLTADHHGHCQSSLWFGNNLSRSETASLTRTSPPHFLFPGIWSGRSCAISAHLVPTTQSSPDCLRREWKPWRKWRTSGSNTPLNSTAKAKGSKSTWSSATNLFSKRSPSEVYL